MIYRPVDEYLRGTGIAAVKHYLKRKLQDKGFEVFDLKKIFNVPPFYSIWSILVYDILVPFFTALTLWRKNTKHIFFVDVAPCLSIGLFKVLYPTKKITTLVHAYPEEHALYLDYIRLLTRMAVYFSDTIICTTQENRSRILDVLKIKNPEKIIVLPLGLTIDDSTECVLNEHKINPIPVFGYIGTSDQRKKLHRIIEMMQYSKRNHLPMKVVTAGPISQAFILQFTEACSEFVTYEHLGTIQEKEKPKFFAGIDAFFFPTAREGFGLPVLEAFFYRKSCIVFETASIPKILKDHCILCLEDLSNFKLIYKQISNSELEEKQSVNYVYAKTFDWQCYVDYFSSVL